jgi:hypothetical protein
MKLGNILQSTNLILSVFIVILLLVILFLAKKEYFLITLPPTPTNNYENLPSIEEMEEAIHDFITTKQTNNIPPAEIKSSLQQITGNEDQNFKIPTEPSSITIPNIISEALKITPEEEENHTLPTNITLLTNATAPL